MNTIQGNGAYVTALAPTSQHVRGTAPISRPQLESAANAAPAAVAPEPVFITEKQVLFSTAAAVQVRPRTIYRWSEVTGGVLAAVHRVSLRSKPDRRQPPRYYPKRYEFLEQSCMARAVDRP